MKHLKKFNENYVDPLSEETIEEKFNNWYDSIDYTEADYTSFKAGYKSAFQNIEYFENKQ